MRLLALGIRDSKTEAWMTPIFVRSRGEAIRSFQDEVNGDPSQSMIAKHPEDFALFLIGEFDVVEGTLQPVEQPVLLASAINLKREG